MLCCLEVAIKAMPTAVSIEIITVLNTEEGHPS